MQKISIEQAAEGMILAKAVKNKKGITLCGEGTKLTEGLIKRLAGMEVSMIVVEGHPVDDGTEEISPESFHEKLQERFRYVANQPILMSLKETIWEIVRKEE